jgi:hypothetical protein
VFLLTGSVQLEGFQTCSNKEMEDKEPEKRFQRFYESGRTVYACKTHSLVSTALDIRKFAYLYSGRDGSSLVVENGPFIPCRGICRFH